MLEVVMDTCDKCGQKVVDGTKLPSRYKCEICHYNYYSKEQAEQCEAQGKTGPVYQTGTVVAVMRNGYNEPCNFILTEITVPSPGCDHEVYLYEVACDDLGIDAGEVPNAMVLGKLMKDAGMKTIPEQPAP